MPKSNFLRKKSKTGSAADFKRLKGKVGKRAPQAASHTDTSFKSKRVRVSAQSILHEIADGEAVTAKGLGVQELLVQLRHYSPASRREALLGLKSIVDRNPRYAEVNFARLAEGSLALAVCIDNDVRKTLLAYQEALLGCVPARTFAPFANIYLAYVVSAMTSLDRAIRRDSLGLLALVLARFPTAVADRVERLAPNYAALLALDPASKKQAGRTEALKSLVSLFRAVSRRHGRSRIVNDAGNGTGSLSTVKTGTSSAARLRWKRGSHRNGALVLSACSGVSVATEIRASGSGGCGGDVGVKGDTAAKALASLLPQMLIKLREVWMEALSAVPPDIGLLQSVVDVLLEAIASPALTADGWGSGSEGKSLASAVEHEQSRTGRRGGRAENSDSCGGIGTSSSVMTWFARFVQLVLEAFPIRLLEGELLGDVEAERLQAIEELNMALCELVVAASTGPAAGAGTAHVAGKGVGGEEDKDVTTWLEPVLAHVHEVLQNGVGNGGAGAQIPRVLRVLKAAICSTSAKGKGFESWTAQRQRLLLAFGDFFASLPPRAGSNLLCVKFICTLTTSLLSGSGSTVGEQQNSCGTADVEATREVRRWLQSFPELLCRWGEDFPEASAAVLQALVEVAKRAPNPPATTSATVIDGGSTGGKFKGNVAIGTGVGAKGGAVTRPTTVAAAASGGAGAWALEAAKLLHGIRPALLGDFFSGRGFLSLPMSAQTNAVSLLYHLPSLPACVMSALAAACSDPTAVHGDVRSFVLEVIHHRRRSLTPSVYLGFLVSVLTGNAAVKHVGGNKRTAEGRSWGVGNTESGAGGSKRRRQQSSTNGSTLGVRDEETLDEAMPPAADSKAAVLPLAAPATLWEVVFARDEITGAVCNSLAIVGSRGCALLDALRPTLLDLLEGRGKRKRKSGLRSQRCEEQTRKASDACSDATATAAPAAQREDDLALTLQGQRAAMACVLCCWEGLVGEACTGSTPNPSSAAGASATTPAAQASNGVRSSPLSGLEEPIALACVQAMRAAGRVDAVEEARGARLLRPMLVLVKRWAALLPAILASIVAAAEVAATGVPAAGTAAVADVVLPGVGTGPRSVEPLLRCLQLVVRDPGLQGQLRRLHVRGLQLTASALCRLLDDSPLRTVVAQLRADVELLGGGVATS